MPWMFETTVHQDFSRIRSGQNATVQQWTKYIYKACACSKPEPASKVQNGISCSRCHWILVFWGATSFAVSGVSGTVPSWRLRIYLITASLESAQSRPCHAGTGRFGKDHSCTGEGIDLPFRLRSERKEN